MGELQLEGGVCLLDCKGEREKRIILSKQSTNYDFAVATKERQGQTLLTRLIFRLVGQIQWNGARSRVFYRFTGRLREMELVPL